VNDPKRLFLQCLAIVIAFGVSVWIYKTLTAPKSYEDCMLKELKGAQTGPAASGIAAACRAKFPKPVIRLTDEQVYGHKVE
jgi:hypothetical protein